MKPFTGMTTTMLPSNGTDIVVNEEMKVETVIVILWISGGLLLIALLILLACILRTNKKGRRSSNPLRPGVFRVLESQNGGVNPSYTSYDEIWTWIPVVRGNEETCQPRPETSRNVTISAAATSRASNLEPPPYSVAIATPVRPYAPAQYTSVTSVTSTTSSYRNTVSSISTISSVPDINPSRSNDRTIQQSLAIGSGQTNLGGGNGGGGGREVTAHARRSAPCLMVTSTPIQSPRVSHRQQATPQRQPQCRDIYCGNGRSSNQTRQSTNVGERDVRSPLPNRRSYHESGDPVLPLTHDRDRRSNDARACANTMRSPNFIYDPEEGVYSYLAGNPGRRIWCDIPPSLMDEDGPPPYTRQTDLASREYYQRRPRTDRPAPIVSLECDYF